MKRYHYNLVRLFSILAMIVAALSALSQSYDIYVFDIKKGTTQKVTSIPNAGEFNASWSPNAKKIAHDVVGTPAAPFEQSIFVTDVKTGVSTPLVGAEGGNDAAWAPGDNTGNEAECETDDAGIIAFDDWHIYPYSIYSVPAKGGTRTLLRSNSHHASWSPNGRRIAFDDNNGYIGTRDIKTGIETLVTWNGDRPSWSPDGQYIAFDAWSWFGGGVWVIKVDFSGNPQGSPVQITTSGYGPTWSNNSKTIYYIDWPNGDPDVWSVPAKGGTATRVCGRIGGFDKGDYDPACSNNGKFIAFSSFTDLSPIATTAKIQGSKTLDETAVMANFKLAQNYPNPFNNKTYIGFNVGATSHVRLDIYTISGQKLITLVNANYNAGSYTCSWNGTDEHGNKVPSGLYLYQVQSGSSIQVKKMIIAR